MKLKTKMIVCMALVFAFFMLALGVALMGMQDAKNRFETFLERDQALLQQGTTLYAQGLQMGQALRNIVLDPKNKNAYKNLDAASAEFKSAHEAALALATQDAALTKALQEIGTLRGRQAPLQAQVTALANENQPVAVAMLNTEETPVWREMRSRLMDIIKNKNAEVNQTKADMIDFTHRMLVASLILAAMAIVLGAGVATWLTRNVMKQLGGEPDYAVGIARRIASGDLTEAIDTSKSDRSSLVSAMKMMQDSLAALVVQVRSG
ncbi:MAG TPA: chemotaxis protein, partial [Noviherbaspirillum sp.]|nr:chemotaxis protein [Noviherbaspirillum sp.]